MSPHASEIQNGEIDADREKIQVSDEVGVTLEKTPPGDKYVISEHKSGDVAPETKSDQHGGVKYTGFSRADLLIC